MRDSRNDLRASVVAEPGRQGDEPSNRRPLVCFSHLRWNFVRQRPQHLLSRAARDYDVTFVEEPVFEAVARATLRITRDERVRIAVPVLPRDATGAETAETLQRDLIEEYLEAAGEPAVLWYYTPMAIPFTRNIEADLVVYDNMDELSAFRGASPAMLRNEDELFARADIVFTGGASLYEAKRGRHDRVLAFPSSIDTRHFHAARKPGRTEPADQAGIPGPRLGFFGVIDERLDLDLVAAMAAARPDWHFVMIGPVAKIDDASLPRTPNLHWLGQKNYAELPSYLAGWDVGLMPFALNEATRFISPTKTPEYLAAGVPVVSTPIRDVIRPYGEKGLVAIADTADSMIKAAERALAGPEPGWLARVDAHLAAGSWDDTWAAMHRAMGDAALPRRTIASRRDGLVATLAAAE